MKNKSLERLCTASVLPLSFVILVIAALTATSPGTAAEESAGASPPPTPPTVFLDQGRKWTDAERRAFYVQDQGSRIMPLAWMKALRQSDGTPFLEDSLTRYGYLKNPDTEAANMPVGFTVANQGGQPWVGMTCAACHTREINVDGTHYRADGGPAFADFQSFLADLDTAVGAELKTADSFDAFAKAVLGPSGTAQQKAALKIEADIWYERYHTLMEGALPSDPWGPSRLDAVTMIFNRLGGLDLGPPPTYLIADNIYEADAPVRYPFLWNAARQDKTQWPGFADNGTELLGLARNLGEVYGVFAIFHPTERNGAFFKLDYLANNSANFDGLKKVEKAIWKIGPPEWPWKTDPALAKKGRAIYYSKDPDVNCVGCHGIKRKRKWYWPFSSLWKTPVLDVGTDVRECEILGRKINTGVMAGTKLPLPGSKKLQENEEPLNVLKVAVIGSIIQHILGFEDKTGGPEALGAKTEPQEMDLPDELKDLDGAFRTEELAERGVIGAESLTPGCAYESRVMEGIWAAAPYLHNGSVPTLEDLLKPAAERPASFKVGPSYDLGKVGLAADQTMFDYELKTTGCEDLSSGNSRCGHEYGTKLSLGDKKALLEYLKTL